MGEKIWKKVLQKNPTSAWNLSTSNKKKKVSHIERAKLYSTF